MEIAIQVIERSRCRARYLIIPILTALLLGVVAVPLLSHAPAPPISSPIAALASVKSSHELQPGAIRFEPNRGQAPADVRFIAHAGRALWLFRPHGITLVLGGNSRGSAVVEIHLTPIGLSRRTVVTPTDRLSGTVNYLLGRTRRNWQVGIPTFAGVEYHSIAPGIDLVFHGHGTALEYDWLIAPGANPDRIGLSVTGVRRIRKVSDGSVVFTTTAGDVRQLPPVIYQSVKGLRRIVAGHYILRANDRIGFWIGAYNHAEPLTIDPTLQYAAVLSGSLDDYANAVTVDSAGNAYVTGATQSDDFPTQTPAQTAFGGETDAFVTKLDPAGKVVYSTYLGGSRYDGGFSIAVDATGDVFVAGATNSKNFPTTPGAAQSQLGGGTCPQSGYSYPCEDAFVAKLDPAGNALIYSTYLGGNQDDWARGIALDTQGDAVVVGATNSPNFPLAHALDRALKAQICGLYATAYPCPDAFIVKLNPTGTGLIFSRLLGGTDENIAAAVAVGSDGTIALTGETFSANFPVVHGMHRVQRTKCKIMQAPAGRCPRAFVATLTGDGAALTFSSYLGGSGRDWGNGIALDASGNIYVAGQTTSSDFPVVHPVQPAHYKGTCHDTNSTERYPCPDAFITKIDPRTGKIVYSSRVGGTALDGASAVAVDAKGDAYIGGYVGSYNFPTLHALQKRSGGGEDAFVLALTPDGSKAYFSTYLGGEHDDGANSIALGPSGDVYLAGSTDSPQFPRSVPYGSVPRGLDAFVVRIHPGKPKPHALPCKLLFGQKNTGCLKTAGR